MKERLTLPALILLGLAMTLSGCTSTSDSGGGGDGDDNSGELGWALDLADPAAEGEMDDPSLLRFRGTLVDDTGRIDDQGTWLFYYGDLEGDRQQVLAVNVTLTGQVITCWFDAEQIDPFWTELPVYRDAEDWVDAADEALDAAGGVAYDYRWVQVDPDGDDDYSESENLCLVAYFTEEGNLMALVTLDADTDEVLDLDIEGE
ncbi:MAG: hypothetical protein NTW26_05675 [bacterium]|nr:hypothetical protein [bacterium]